MASEKKQMVSHGAQQTGYADWAKAMLMHYPYNPKFQREGEQVNVFYKDEKVGQYDFSKGTGSLVLEPTTHSKEEIGRLPNLQEFDIDTLIQK
jgi:hypothetical protein